MEPAKRSFIGARPSKLVEVVENKTYFIDTVEVAKSSATSIPGTWLDGCKLSLNPDLVAIIGNKGSGKSALPMSSRCWETLGRRSTSLS